MRIVIRKNRNQVICRNPATFRAIKKFAPKKFELKQHLNDGGYWTHSYEYDLITINRWLQENNFKVKFEYLNGCFYPFLMEVVDND